MTQRSLKKPVLAVVAVAVVAGLAALAYALAPTATRNIGPGPAGTAPPSAALIEAGRYVATASDCIACHTAPGGKPFAGGLGIASPIGTMYSSNITPDKTTGIGNYSLDDFDRAVRHGITPSGATLYPAMPYPSYAKLKDDDLRALYAYFMHGVEAAPAENKPADIVWPLSIRWPLGIWRKTFAPETAPFDASKYADAVLGRGAYLVQSMGHCGTCHTPRAATLQEVALDESQGGYLSGGGAIDGWVAVNLRGDSADGLGRWSQQDIVDTLLKARNSHAAVVGNPMADVVLHSTQHMAPADLQAMAVYLKSLPAGKGEKASFVASDDTAKALLAGQESGRGAQLYLDNCAACHRSDGKANGKVFPALPGNQTVLDNDPSSLIRLVLGGGAMPSTEKAPSNLGMPAFAWRLSDEEAAQVISFIRQSWGNKASDVSSSDVAKVRKALAQEGHGKPAMVAEAH